MSGSARHVDRQPIGTLNNHAAASPRAAQRHPAQLVVPLCSFGEPPQLTHAMLERGEVLVIKKTLTSSKLPTALKVTGRPRPEKDIYRDRLNAPLVEIPLPCPSGEVEAPPHPHPPPPSSAVNELTVDFGVLRGSGPGSGKQAGEAAALILPQFADWHQIPLRSGQDGASRGTLRSRRVEIISDSC